MKSTPSISKLIIYIYVLLAIAGAQLIIIATFLTYQATKTSQQEQRLSQYLLPVIFDLQKLDRETIELQRMHSRISQDENTQHTPLEFGEKKKHVLVKHLHPIQRFMKNINNNQPELEPQIIQSAIERLNDRYRHFNSTQIEFFNATNIDKYIQAFSQSTQLFIISIRQITRLYQREANKLTNNLNDTYHNGLWQIAGMISLVVFAGLLIAARIIRLAKSTITQQQASDAELLQHQNNLEHLVQQRTSDLEIINKELQSYSYSIAHDLRAPLRAITSFSQILFDEAGFKLNDNEKADLARISDAGIRMAELIDDILELSTVTRAELKLQKTDLSKIALAFTKEHSSPNPGQAIEIRIEENIFANTDPQLIRLAIDHLLSNAIKYSSNRKIAIIKFGIEKTDNETTYFVRDNGIGFDMRYTDKLFQAFERVQDKHSLDGSGVGLALVQRVITKHGGRIWANAKIGQGATFYFTLPEHSHPSTN